MAGIVKVIKKNDNFEMYPNVRMGDMYNFTRIDKETIEVINGMCDCIAEKYDEKHYIYQDEDAVIEFKVVEE